MTITEKIAYIKGLAAGLKLDENKPEVKVINAMLDLLNDLSRGLTDMGEVYDDLNEQVEEIDEDLAELESFVYDTEGDFDYDDDFDFDDDNPFYEVTCGACGEKINVSEDVLLEGEIECPNCGELLEFDFSELFDDEFTECDLNCDGCMGCDDKDDKDDKDGKSNKGDLKF